MKNLLTPLVPATRRAMILPRIMAACLALAALAPLPAAAECLSPGAARRAVASGEAVRLSEIASLVDGDIVNAELCERGNGLVYRLAVIREGNKVVTVVVDAQSGTVLR